jgi:hypothetical protein
MNHASPGSQFLKECPHDKPDLVCTSTLNSFPLDHAGFQPFGQRQSLLRIFRSPPPLFHACQSQKGCSICWVA